MSIYIVEPFADGNHFVGHNGIQVKNTKLINGDYNRMHGVIQSLAIDMLKKANIWAVREPMKMFHGLVPRECLHRYCTQIRATKDFIIPDIVTHNVMNRHETNNILRRKSEIKSGSEKGKQSVKSYRNRYKHLGDTLSPGDESKPLTSAYRPYGEDYAECLVIGNFGEINNGFRKFSLWYRKIFAR